MSIACINWVWKNERETKSSVRLMLLAIADNCNDQGECYPGLDYLAMKVNVTRSNALVLVNTLEWMGIVGVIVGAGIPKLTASGNKIGDTNRYILLPYAKDHMEIHHHLLRKPKDPKAYRRGGKAKDTPNPVLKSPHVEINTGGGVEINTGGGVEINTGGDVEINTQTINTTKDLTKDATKTTTPLRDGFSLNDPLTDDESSSYSEIVKATFGVSSVKEKLITSFLQGRKKLKELGNAPLQNPVGLDELKLFSAYLSELYPPHIKVSALATIADKLELFRSTPQKPAKLGLKEKLSAIDQMTSYQEYEVWAETHDRYRLLEANVIATVGIPPNKKLAIDQMTSYQEYEAWAETYDRLKHCSAYAKERFMTPDEIIQSKPMFHINTLEEYEIWVLANDPDEDYKNMLKPKGDSSVSR